MTPFDTLTSALLAQKGSHARIGVVDELGETDTWSYDELRQRAYSFLAHLQSVGVERGDELVIAHRSMANVMTAYWAALFGGLVPVPLSAPNSDRDLEKLHNIWNVLANPWLAMDDETVLRRLDATSSEARFGVIEGKSRVLVTEDCSAHQGEGEADVAEVGPDDIALVQFSSGSTGAPKGVTLTHRNLLCNAYDIIDASIITHEDVFLSWKPISHDFGMIAFHITPVVAGASQFRMATKHFIWNATDWLTCASRLRATILGTPNFGVQHLLSRVDQERARREEVDLSSVRMVWNAAEMINAELCRDFVSTLAPFGLREDVFRPGYGLAENTLVVSVVREGQHLETVVVNRARLGVGEAVEILSTDAISAQEGVELVLCGEPCTHSEVRVVDDVGVAVPDGTVGRLQVHGDCVTPGYYLNSAASEEILLADGWMDTQDLGFLHRGQVVVVGRRKDIIIIGGVNYHPSDIENVILRGVGRSKLNQYVACAVPHPILQSDQLVVFVHHRGRAERFVGVAREVRRLVMTDLGLTVEDVVPVSSIPRTTSGKVQRFRLVQDYLAHGRESAVTEAPRTRVADRDALAGTVLAVVKDFVTLPPGGNNRSLFELGCTSLQLVSLQEALQERLGLRLESTFVLDHPTVDDMIASLSARTMGTTPERGRPPLRGGSDEPIAILGMGFRFPGDLRTEAELWRALEARVDQVGPLPAGRWMASGLDPSEITTRHGGYLSEVDLFDPFHFGVSPTEAQAMDPQHRLLLELSWEALEDAGLDPLRLGSEEPVGVMVGISSHDYLQVARDLGHEPGPYTYTGGMANAAAGRLSFTYGFRGPTMAIDTACSSSLYAVHQAVRELRQGTCRTALAAGVNLILSPEGHLSFSRLNALAPSGRCRSFDERADGYVRSEGAAVLVLKRLDDAQRDGDDVLAVIRGTAVNHNGRSGGFTVPSGEAQASVIRDALADAGLTPADITYVEAHGSGTPLGDPQELHALASVFAGRDSALPVGSVKSNFGHLEAAAGMAGMCKVIASLRSGVIPGTVGLETPNRLVDWDDVPLVVREENMAWQPAPDGVRRAGVSSFGISGSNAHVIVEEHRVPEGATEPSTEEAHLLRISAASESALAEAVTGVAAWGHDVPLADVAASLNARAALPYRAALVPSSGAELPEMAEHAVACAHHVQNGSEPLAFVFPGQGSQYPGMLVGLYEASPAFREELHRIGEVLSAASGFSVVSEMLSGTEEAFASPRVTQPLIFAAELALARHWSSLGVRAGVVLGHSIGEYAAACFAGVLSLPDACAMVSARGRLMAEAPSGGYLATLLCPLREVQEMVAAHENTFIAAINGLQNVTVGGSSEAMDALRRDARGRRVFVETLSVSHAFHTPLMAAGAGRLLDELSGVTFADPVVDWISAQTGRRVVPGDIDAAYWGNHLMTPVHFTKAVATVRTLGFSSFLEVGASPPLTGLIAQDHADTDGFASLRKGREDRLQFLQTAGELWKRGHQVDATMLPGGCSGKRLRDLPHTPVERRPTWYPVASRIPSSNSQAAQETTMSRHVPLQTVSPQLAHDEVVMFLRQALNQITGIAPERLPGSVELFSLGMDSLMLVQLGRRVEKEYSVNIPIRTFFDSLHTLDQVAAHVCEVAQPRVTTPRPVADPTLDASVPAPPEQLGAVIEAQLRIMEHQLALLGGGGGPALGVTSTPSQAVRINPAAEATATTDVRATGTYSNNIELARDVLTPRQESFVAEFVEEFVSRTRRSREYAAQHRSVLADWIASLNYNPSIERIVYPLVSSRSAGAHFWDLDGNEYLDTAMGYGVHFFGHQPDFVMEALREQMEAGFELGPQNKDAGEVAAMIAELTGVERVAFCNTGSEAVMVALRLARTVTGRDRIVKFVTSFHGSFDGVLAEADGDNVVPMTVGTPPSMVRDTLVLTYGSEEALRVIAEQGDSIAAVLVEPVQSRNPSLQPRQFLHQLRRVCDERGIALIFDEMITGFRINTGGAQAHFGVRADMVLYGKLIGGGLPIGLVAGSSTYLDAVDGGAWNDMDGTQPAAQTTFFAGTFCKHPLTMAACRAVLTHVKEHGAEDIDRANRLTERFVEQANEYFEADSVPLRAVHFGSMYRFEPVVAAEMDTFTLETNLLFKLMAARGVYVWERRTAFFSTAHSDEDAEHILSVVRASVDALRGGGFSFRRSASSAAVAIAPAMTEAPVMLSSQERRIYVLSLMRGGNEAYQILGSLGFEEPIPDEHLDEAFAAIAVKHQKLRASFVVEGEEIVSRVAAEITPRRVSLEHVVRSSEVDPDALLDVLNAPFDLAEAPLWRYGTLVDATGRQSLFLSVHHLIADGRSVELILADLAEFLRSSHLVSVGSRPYADFVSLQRQMTEQASAEASRTWWLEQFQPLPPPLELPADAPRPEITEFAGGHRGRQLDDAVVQAVAAVISECRSTPFVFHLTAWALLLGEMSGSRDLCIGVPHDQRALGDFGDTVGMFAQSLPLRIFLDPAIRVRDLLVRVRELSLAAVEHSVYTYDDLIQDLDISRDFGRNPLFDTLFTFTNATRRTDNFGGVRGTTQDVGGRRSMVDLSLELTERDGHVYADLNHAAMFSSERADAIVAGFEAILRQIVADPNLTVGDVTLLDEGARQRMLELGTGPQMAVTPLWKIIEDACEASPEAMALESAEGVQLTYRELSELADRHVALLRREGIGVGDVLGLLLPLGADLVVWMLASLRVGCAWTMLDVQQPLARLADMIETAEPSRVVCSAEFAETLELGSRSLVIDADALPEADGEPGARPEGDLLAYVIFTSGSTGRPKGVQLTHGALANFVVGMSDALRWARDKRVANLTTPSFDIYLLETLVTLAKCGTIIIGDSMAGATPGGIASLVVEQRVDYLQMTPTRLRLLMTDAEAASRTLRAIDKLIVGGEAFPSELLEELQSYDGLEIHNVYGPTETCVWSSVSDLSEAAAVTIGSPISNTNLYVLDDELHLVPEGTVGSLWIGGMGVSPGYLNRPDLNKGVFRDDPFCPGRMYLTGDQARWVDGELYCLGRIDNQVKIRGYRVELEEIESVMAAHPEVTAAAVVMERSAVGNSMLCGFYQPAPGADPDPRAVRAWLADRVADYMVPAMLTSVPMIPLNSNGKVDRRALPASSVTASDGQVDAVTVTSIEEQVARAWRGVLPDVAVGREDSFFDLGGNSFSIVLLLAELNRVFGDILDVSDLFAHPTVASQAACIASLLDPAIDGRAEVVVPPSWFDEADGHNGRVEAEVASNSLRVLTVEAMSLEEVAHALFAFTLSRVVGLDDLSLSIVKGPDVHPVRLDFSGEKELAEVVQDMHRQVERSDGPARLKAPSADGFGITIALTEGADAGGALLRYFDLVAGVETTDAGLRVSIDHGRRLGTPVVTSLLSSFLTLVEAVGDQVIGKASQPTKEE